MRGAIVGLLALGVAGCATLAAGPNRMQPLAPTYDMALYNAKVQIRVAMPRRVQTLPDFWDTANFSVEMSRLRHLATESVATATSSITTTMLVPPGAATVSVELRSGGIPIASGSLAANLVSGLNPVTISLSPRNSVVLTLAGNSTAGSVDGTGAAAQFNSPEGLAVDSSGSVYVADSQANKIRKISPSGVVTTIGGTGIASISGDGGPATAATFNAPSDVALDSAQTKLYVADTLNSRIRMINLTTGIVSTFAGSAATGSIGGSPAGATFYNPRGIAFDNAGNLFIADTGNNLIREVSTSNLVSTVIATGLNTPWDLAVDGSGSLFITNYGTNQIMSYVGGLLSTLSGTLGAGLTDGASGSAKFNGPKHVVYNAGDSMLYVADEFNNTIRKVDSAGNVTSLFGTTAGMLDGDPATAQFNHPLGLAIKTGVPPSGMHLYIGDDLNHRVRLRLYP